MNLCVYEQRGISNLKFIERIIFEFIIIIIHEEKNPFNKI